MMDQRSPKRRGGRSRGARLPSAQDYLKAEFRATPKWEDINDLSPRAPGLEEARKAHRQAHPGLPIQLFPRRRGAVITMIRTTRGFGDIISAFGGLSALKTAHPDLAIDLCVHPDIGAIFEGHPVLRRVVSDPSEIDPESEIVDAGTFMGYMGNTERDCKVPDPGPRPVIFATSLGLDHAEAPQLYVPPKDRLWAREWFADRELTNPIGFVWRTSTVRKDYAEARREELYLRLQWDKDLYVIEAHEELDAGPSTHGLTIKEQVALVAESRLIVGPDTGWMHVAGAVGIPMVGLFGSYPGQQTLSIYGVPLLILTGPCPIGLQPCRHHVPCMLDDSLSSPPCLDTPAEALIPMINHFIEQLP